MNYRLALSVLALSLVAPLSNGQQLTMSANTGLGPGNSFTLFIVFQDPMPKIQGIGCSFRLDEATKPGQEDFTKGLRCSGAPIKDDDTHYRVKVDIPQRVAAGNYVIDWINVAIDDVGHPYSGSQLPNLPHIAITNPEHLEFSPIQKLDIK